LADPGSALADISGSIWKVLSLTLYWRPVFADGSFLTAPHRGLDRYLCAWAGHHRRSEPVEGRSHRVIIQ
jgi:hypothetical protein